MSRPADPTEDPVVTTTDPTRRVAPPAEAAGAVASLLSLLSAPRGSSDLREVALALRDLAGTLDRIAARQEMPSPGASYTVGWVPHQGA
jgi:hypothetical protein